LGRFWKGAICNARIARNSNGVLLHSVVWEENNSAVAELSGWGDGKA